MGKSGFADIFGDGRKLLGRLYEREKAEEYKKMCERKGDFVGEDGKCMGKPWKGFTDCDTAKHNGDCPLGRKPDPWVAMNCPKTCAK